MRENMSVLLNVTCVYSVEKNEIVYICMIILIAIVQCNPLFQQQVIKIVTKEW